MYCYFIIRCCLLFCNIDTTCESFYGYGKVYYSSGGLSGSRVGSGVRIYNKKRRNIIKARLSRLLECIYSLLCKVDKQIFSIV